MICGGGGHYRRLVGEQGDESVAPKGIKQGEDRTQGEAPCKKPVHGGDKRPAVACAVIAAAERLAGVCETVHEIGKEQIKLHEQRVDGQHDVALPRAGGGEKQHDRHHAKCAEEDVAVDGEELRHGVASPKPLPHEVAAQASVMRQAERKSHEETRILGYERAEGHALDLQPAGKDEQCACRYVDNVLCYGYEHGQTGVLHADEPARKAEQPENGRCSPDEYVEIDGRKAGHFRLWLHYLHDTPKQRFLEYDKRKGHGQGYAEGAEEHTYGVVKVAPSERLCRHSARSHAQKSEYPVYHIERHSSHGDGSDVCRRTEMSHYCHVYKPEQRHRYVAHYRRNGYVQYLSVVCVHRYEAARDDGNGSAKLQ